MHPAVTPAPVVAPIPSQGKPVGLSEPRYVQPPVPVPSAAMPPSAVPMRTDGPLSASKPPKPKARFPKWLVLIGIIGLVLCVALAALVVVYRPWEGMLVPTATSTSVPTATAEPTLTPTPSVTPTMVPESSEPALPQVSFNNPPSIISIGETLPLTVTIHNTTGVTLTEVGCQISGLWHPYMGVEDPVQLVHDIANAASAECVFSITGYSVGDARIQIYVTAKEHLDILPTNEITIEVK